jgi:hypothetical protein
MNEALLNKLKKLLNLSQSANANEAELALQKATQLATEAGIDLAIVAARGEPEQEKLEMTEITLETGARLPSTQKYASWLLSHHFNVHVIYNGSRYNGRRVNILGDRKDVEFAKFVNEFIQDEMQRRWDYYKKSNNLSVKFKQTFLYNLYLGLDQKLKSAKKQAEETKFASLPKEIVPDVQIKYGLVVSNKAQSVLSYRDQLYPSLRSSRVSITNYSGTSVASDGYRVGQSININRPISC